MKRRLAILTMAAALGVGGCASMTTTEQRTLSGAAIGALGGAAIAAVSAGSVATGAAIGAGVGAGAGYLYSRNRNDASPGRHAAQPAKRQQLAHAAKPPTQPPARASDQMLASDSRP